MSGYDRLPKLNRADVNHYLNDYTDKYSHLSPEAVVTKHQGKLSGSDDLFEPMDVDEAGEIPSFDNFFSPPPKEVQEPEEPQITVRFIPDELPEYPLGTQLIYECHMKPKEEIHFQVEVPELDNISLFLLQNQHHGLLKRRDWAS
jgi:hypothetical protein